MAVAFFDTHALIKELTTGKGAVSNDTAEKMVTAIKIAQDASRDELATRADVAVLRNELQLQEARLNGKLESLEARMMNKILAGQIATMVLLFGALKYLMH